VTKPELGPTTFMNDEAQAWFRMAQDNLDTAQALRNIVSPVGCVNYFAMFHTATAMSGGENVP
jgi:hypothetical protein